MLKEAFITWILTAMTTMAPPHRQHWVPEAQESIEQANSRYRDIATTIVEGVFDPEVQPVFGGKYGRQRSAMFVVVWWNGESGFRRDVDLGLGRARLARSGWNDYGRSWCMGQVNLGRKRRPDPERKGEWIEDSPTLTPEGWSGRDLCDDRRKCLVTTLRIMRQSIGACRNLPPEERMAAYAAGYCESYRGQTSSRARMRVFNRFYAQGKPTYTDEEVMESIAEGAEPLENKPIAGSSRSVDTR